MDHIVKTVLYRITYENILSLYDAGKSMYPVLSPSFG